MLRSLTALTLALLLPAASSSAPAPAIPADGPTYNAAGELNLPGNYREWVFLNSGLDINYNTPDPATAGHSIFQNVFVNPSAYKSFLATGTWPDKTVFVLELRAADAKASIDRRGQTQGDVRAIEVHVKDEARFKAEPHFDGKWGFFVFGSGTTAKLTERTATCYTCHEAHAAVDTTFVQFYPTLMPLAKTKATLSPAYLKDIAAAAADAK